MRKNNAHSSFHSSIIMTMELGRFVWNRGTDSYTVVDLLRSSHTLYKDGCFMDDPERNLWKDIMYNMVMVVILLEW